MDNKFNRFLKETKADQQKKEREERKALKEIEKRIKLLKKLLKKDAQILMRESKKKDSKQKISKTMKAINSQQNKPQEEASNLGWEEGGLWSWSSESPEMPTNTKILETSESEEQKDLIVLEETKEDKEPSKPESILDEDPKSLFEIFRVQGNKKWLGQDYPAARAAFNLINSSFHPEKPLADGIAILAVKGTSFEGKRIACLETYRNLHKGLNSGEIELIPDPENPHDPNAVGVFDAKTKRQLGFIPKAKDVNQCYGQSIKEGKFVGGYIIDGKETFLKNQENALLIIATGWLLK